MENGASVTNIIIDIPNYITGEPYKIQQRFLWGSAKSYKKNSHKFLGLKDFDILTKITNLKWVNVFKNSPSKICGRQPLKNLKSYDLPK